jgi:uncharacterized protein YecE (DUF72 family)
MSRTAAADLEHFRFHHIHPLVKMGTASDRYAGWLGQIYSKERYRGRVNQCIKVVGEHSFTEEVLPVDSVTEYFEHFPIMEIEFTFYRPLRDQNGKPTQTFQVLKAYQQHLRNGDSLLLKVPQMVTAPRLRRGNQYRDNPSYLNAEIFTRQFYEPAKELLGPTLAGFIFEQEYLAKQDRPPANDMAAALDKFFQAIPRDHRYHLELRTDLYLREPIFEVLEKHGVGQVLSHWTVLTVAMSLPLKLFPVNSE